MPAGTLVDLATAARIASVWAGDGAVVAGWAAAELLDASCGPPGAAVDLLGRHGRPRSRGRPGIRVRRDRLYPDEVTWRYGTPVTTPACTAFDLARWPPTLTERVVGVDTIAHVWRVSADDLRRLWRRHLGVRGSAGLDRVLRLTEPSAESPMATRIRLALVLGGLPPPRVQYPVLGYRLDLAYPPVKVAIEYDGRDHRSQERAHLDLERQARLTAAGWRVLRFTARTVLAQPERMAHEVRAVLDAPVGRRHARP